ncbi:hypothetical protein TVAG_308610 [Trichomonas vaginalis G3]|uniref:Uncharacterized protein n=1 Tax=Trichomonas vaginalis (strain ATCC PRA-98 / G3) TaxID=412133 RepID=A2FVG2_TRIV3|nr:armadillo (ARM) repeat-containing protein family [Trichomonas vaginalis G3]EAX91101.1 hypothetical protein TVAG_308610 [Trichomonas vaginalis G3]KAI5482258.1 armadillo (ARM) repeat-containing protein family [Trichomonas vaginalis G3]|eukprot:XP_001304031.1 hypothetical protein [Trichomonas vaginalis G3]
MKDHDLFSHPEQNYASLSFYNKKQADLNKKIATEEISNTIENLIHQICNSLSEEQFSQAEDAIKKLNNIFNKTDDMPYYAEEFCYSYNLLFHLKDYITPDNSDFSANILTLVCTICYSASSCIEQILEGNFLEAFLQPMLGEGFSSECVSLSIRIAGCIAADSQESAEVIKQYDFLEKLSKWIDIGDQKLLDASLFYIEQFLVNSHDNNTTMMFSPIIASLLGRSDYIFANNSSDEMETIQSRLLNIVRRFTAFEEAVQMLCQTNLIDVTIDFLFNFKTSNDLSIEDQIVTLGNIVDYSCSEYKNCIAEKVSADYILEMVDKSDALCAQMLIIVQKLIESDENFGVHLFTPEFLGNLKEKSNSSNYYTKKSILSFICNSILRISLTSTLEIFLDEELIDEIAENSSPEAVAEGSNNFSQKYFIDALIKLQNLPCASQEIRDFISNVLDEI